ncbi:SusC/RagA family TonB-linked outer membrane protein [Ekhidna sp.]
MKRRLFIGVFIGCLFGLHVFAVQSNIINGKVTDASTGDVLPGVTVRLLNTTQGAVTDIDGNYRIETSDTDGTLRFSYVGFETLEVLVQNRNIIDISLQEDLQALNEVVVVGYGQQRKADLIGAVTKIDSRQIEELPVASFDQALKGLSAGVQTRQSGQPGGGVTVTIRGVGSANNNNPLYVIDGFPIGNIGGGGDNFNLNWLSTSDIESISVLKDVSAKAIYGSRAANGVVIITTKGGKKGKPIVSLSSRAGFQDIPEYQKPKVMNATQLARFQRERIEDNIRAGGNEPTEEDIPEEFRNPEQYGEGTDWFDELTQNGIFQEHNLNMRGGTENVNYSFSVGHLQQEGVVINTEFERYSAQAKVQGKISDRLTYGINMAPSYTLRTGGSTDPNASSGFGVFGSVLSTYWADPSAPVRDRSGNINGAALGDLTTFWVASPVAKMKWIRDERENLSMLTGTNLQLKIIEGLTAKTSFSYNFNTRNVNTFTPSRLPGSSLQPNPEGSGLATAGYSEESRKNWVWENTINYNKKFGRHDVNVLLGYSMEKRRSEGVGINARNLIEESFQLPVSSGNVNTENVNNFTGGTGATQNRLISYLGRVNYVFDDRYYFTASGRVDGSSKFGKSERYGFFPSAAAAWRISNESFWSGLKSIFSDVKVEVAYGFSGSNSGIGNFAAQGNVGQVNYVFGSGSEIGLAPGSVVNGLPNDQVIWEETEEFDIGLDIGLLENRIYLSLDYYNMRTIDFLTNIPVPVTTGFGSIPGNAGQFSNRGIEIELNTSDLIKLGRFSYDINLNFTRNVNEVEKLANEQLLRGAAGNGSSFTITRAGLPIGNYRGLKITGLYTQEEIDDPDVLKYPGAVVGSIKYVDGDGDGQLEDEEDYLILGNPLPDFYYGMTHRFAYRNFDLTILMNGEVGSQIFDISKQSTENLDGVFNLLTEIENRFRPGDDPSTKTIPTTVSATGKWRIPNSDSVKDNDFLAVTNITLGYTFSPNDWATKVFNRLRVYSSVQNPFFIYKEFELGHPETARVGDNTLVRNVFQGSFPIARTYTLGLNVTFN